MGSLASRTRASVRWSAKKATQVLGVGLALLLFCLPGFSQLTLGRILGGITDQTGGVVAGATVTIIDVARGIAKPLATDSAGEYNAPNLLPGMYTVRVEAKGFRTVERQNIQVEVAGEVRVDVSLQPGEQTQTITVTEALPMINTTNATLGGTVENKEVADLPINGRNFQNMFDFRPGMISKPGGGSVGHSTNGLQGANQVYMLEGQYSKAVFGGQNVIGGNNDIGEAATIVNIDAVQEMNLIEIPKAEYGWDPGAVANIGLKSGTNSIHGVAYAYGRTGAMDAANPFTPGVPEALQLEQFGAVVGGPIKKDKLFYFGAYEGKQLTTTQAGTLVVPTTASLGSDSANSFPDAIAAMNLGSHPVSTLSELLAGCDPTKINAGMTTGAAVAPACNAANGVFGNSRPSATYSGTTPNSSNSNNWIAKINQHINDHHALTGEYLIGRNYTIESSGPAIQTYWNRLNPIQGQEAGLIETWTPNSTWVNEARLGWHQIHQNIQIGECNGVPGSPNYGQAFGLNTGTAVPCAFPGFTIGGTVTFTGMGCGTGATGNCDPEPRFEDSYKFADSVSYTRGKHLFKYGFEFRLTNFTGVLKANQAGVINFGTSGVSAFAGATGLQDFLAGDASSGTFRVGDPERHARQFFYAGFIQDDWRFTSRLTFNLGLRYEYETPISDVRNNFGGFIPTSSTGLVQPGVTPGAPSTPYHGDPDQFFPRLGIAWDINGKGTTVVRASGGVFSEFTIWQGLWNNAQWQLDPTGAALYDPSGKLLADPGNMAVANVTISGLPNCTGTACAGGVANPMPWVNNLTTANTPIFNTITPRCGNGIKVITPPAPALPFTPQPCTIGAVNPNIGQAYVTEWSLGVQHAFTNDFSLDIAYVGNHSTGLWGLSNINQPALGVKGAANEQQARPYYGLLPYAGNINYYGNRDKSNYDGLQLTLTQRVSHGISFVAGYTLAHALSVADAENAGLNMDGSGVVSDYGSSGYDARDHFTIHGSWAIPGRKSPGQMLEGWQLNSVFNLLTALPFNAIDSTDDLSGTNGKLDRWTLAGDPSVFRPILGAVGQLPCFGVSGSSFGKAGTGCIVVTALPSACINAAMAEPVNANVPSSDLNSTGLKALNNIGCYMVGNTVMVPPAQGTYGNMSRDELRAQHLREWDASITKDWKFRERYKAQFRAEMFNVINSTQYGPPKTNLASPSNFGQATTTGNSGNAINGSGGPRSIQLALRLSF